MTTAPTADSPPSEQSHEPIPRAYWIGLAVFTLFWALMRYAHAEIVDDAMITFTYARNLAEGVGFVFNPLEWIYGSTVPLFGAFVTLGIIVGIEPWDWVLGWDVLWGAGMMWRLLEILRAAKKLPAWWGIAAVMIITAPVSMPVAGMETGVYIFLLMSVCATIARKSEPSETMLWGSIAAMIRPDGIVIFGIAVYYAILPLLQKKEFKKAIVNSWPVLLGIIYATILYRMYGTIKPHSMVAKEVMTKAAEFSSQFWYFIGQSFFKFYGSLHVLGILSLVGALMAFKMRDVKPLVVYLLFYWLLMLAGLAPTFLWYYTPVFVVMIMLAGVACYNLSAFIFSIIKDAKGIRVQPSNLGTVSFVMMLLSLLPQLTAYYLANERAFQIYGVQLDQKSYREAAMTVRLKDNRRVASVAAHEIGFIGYYLEGYVFDLEGLVSPDTVEARRMSHDPLHYTRVPWVIHSFNYLDPIFIRREFDKRMERNGYLLARTIPWEFGITRIYRRQAGGYFYLNEDGRYFFVPPRPKVPFLPPDYEWYRIWPESFEFERYYLRAE